MNPLVSSGCLGPSGRLGVSATASAPSFFTTETVGEAPTTSELNIIRCYIFTRGTNTTLGMVGED